VAYGIRLTSSAKHHLQKLSVGERALIVGRIEKQLSHEPMVETRNRKRLRPNPVAPWELRVGKFRVFYDIEESSMVTVLAIGVKQGNRLHIEGKEIEL
jgi:mRNA-degrading endonuclease RelE of RelBE toxin-antitoxin system